MTGVLLYSYDLLAAFHFCGRGRVSFKGAVCNIRPEFAPLMFSWKMYVSLPCFTSFSNFLSPMNKENKLTMSTKQKMCTRKTEKTSLYLLNSSLSLLLALLTPNPKTGLNINHPLDQFAVPKTISGSVEINSYHVKILARLQLQASPLLPCHVFSSRALEFLVSRASHK